MKSYVNYPVNFEKKQFPNILENNSAKLFAEYALYKKVSHLKGTVIKCGVETEEGFTKVSMFQNVVAKHSTQKVVAFEKLPKSFEHTSLVTRDGSLLYQTKKTAVNQQKMQDKLLEKGLRPVEFIPGNVGDSIPDYLVENPECKITYLSINLDNYHASISVLDFFYPRLVLGGVLIIDNYSKKTDDYNAVKDYFRHDPVEINSFSVNKGPHFISRQ
jgi:hypothetical protein